MKNTKQNLLFKIILIYYNLFKPAEKCVCVINLSTTVQNLILLFYNKGINLFSFTQFLFYMLFIYLFIKYVLERNNST